MCNKYTSYEYIKVSSRRPSNYAIFKTVYHNGSYKLHIWKEKNGKF